MHLPVGLAGRAGHRARDTVFNLIAAIAAFGVAVLLTVAHRMGRALQHG